VISEVYREDRERRRLGSLTVYAGPTHSGKTKKLEAEAERATRQGRRTQSLAAAPLGARLLDSLEPQTELVVMITPQILERASSGVTPTLPGTPEPFLPPIPAKKLVEPLPPAFTPARSGLSGSGAMRPSDGMPGSAAPAPAAAAPSPAAAEAIRNPPHPPVVVVGPGAAGVDPAPARQLSADEQRVLDSTQQPTSTAKPLSETDQKKPAEAQRKKDKADQELAAKAAKQQAKRDADAARVAAE